MTIFIIPELAFRLLFLDNVILPSSLFVEDFFGAKLDDTRVTLPFDFNALIYIHKLSIITKCFTSFQRLYFDFDGFHFYIFLKFCSKICEKVVLLIPGKSPCTELVVEKNVP